MPARAIASVAIRDGGGGDERRRRRALTALAACDWVSVVYGRGEAQVEALRDVDLEIAAGDHLALLGRSGSGKTTLLHVLGGLLVPTPGT